MTMMKSPRMWRDMLVVGFAMFAVFFGAGNLIFPPQVGFQTGADWEWGLLGLLVTGMLLPTFGVVAVGLRGGTFERLTRPIAPWFGTLLLVVSMTLVAWLVTIPRTGAVAFETGKGIGAAQKRGRVPVVTAHVPALRDGRGMGHVARFLDRQRVQFRPQHDRGAGRGPVEDAGHPMPAQVGHDPVGADLAQLGGHPGGGLAFLPRNLGCLVQQVPEPGQIGDLAVGQKGPLHAVQATFSEADRRSSIPNRSRGSSGSASRSRFW